MNFVLTYSPVEKITPGLEASDDLSLSNLVVGKKYTYCIRAINKDHYMDHPYDSYKTYRSITSSDATCSSHTVKWESSFHGRVTTEPDAGNLPIEDVVITWNLLDKSHKQLDCDGCSGRILTNDGGSFNIVFKVEHESLLGRNDDDIPVQIFFQKTTKSSPEDIEHIFLCEDGTIECDVTNGYIVYISHLQYK